ncbi:putative repeat protein (TIGR01451 family) [Spirosoma oryzae]|uniref:Putative repeat protein (TIGR01451 family) n=1 Tax=Spirosoma oryzae TaxID=1469603 RepID=A0A2T0SCB7_9BACT|nr:sialate O-acetylesterase [Spirosoma oryzae]PRY31064.1 putative repeat protein (TIGR01451 family) [Spirosoma oryzae]
MIFRVVWLTLLLAGLCSFSVSAQLTITSPVTRMVFQRNQANQASILVTGTAPATATTIDARFVPLSTGQGSVTAWTSLSLLSGSRVFRGFVTVPAGWYRLDVRAVTNGSVVAQTSVNRVGVGEVFVVAGQSNAVGGFEREPGATDDRVSCVDIRQINRIEEHLYPLQFSHASAGSNIGPSQPPHIWARLGDKLVSRLNVPVLFLGAAQPGTSSTQWLQSAIGTSGDLFPYQRLGSVLRSYVARTGMRAVLWHQGEGDIGSAEATYFANMKAIIGKSRAQVAFNQLAWLVSRVSYTQGATNPGVISAQNRLASEVNDVFNGPATDDLTGSDNRLGDNVHLAGNGLVRFIDRWDQSLNTDFFTRSTPYTPANASSLVTSGYPLSLVNRPGDVLLAPSFRTAPTDSGNQYYLQLVNTGTNTVVSESARGLTDPLSFTLPASLNGSYQLRTVATAPALTGTLSEPFTVSPSAPGNAYDTPTPAIVQGGTLDSAIIRIGYRYETDSHGFFAMIQANTPVETRMQRLDGGPFSDTDWRTAPSASQAPDYPEFIDFNYVRSYPPVAMAVGGVEPGRYRLSIRKQGSTGDGIWFETTLLYGRTTLYQGSEPVTAVPPVLTLTDPVPNVCPGDAFSVGFTRTESAVDATNLYTVQLSDTNGSFTNPTAIGSGTSSPISVTLPATTSPGDIRRIRLVASSPAVSSAASETFVVCTNSTNPADLSMTMQVDTRVAALNKPITCTLSVMNAGPSTARNVVLQSRLPGGLSFVDAKSTTISSASGVVTINAGPLSAGSQTNYVFRLQATQPGNYALAAQVTACQTPDPDSQPNSGTGDGQDDAATIDLRTTPGKDTLYTSPNPNQVPLPTVQANQPATSSSSADLSLMLSPSQLTVPPSGTLNVSLTVNNRGGANASSVGVQVLLPSGWQLLSGSSLSQSGQIVSGTIAGVSSADSATVRFTVRVSSAGTLQAQISSSSIIDPDSTPGNGYTNGEDDTASLMIRLK